MSRRAAMTLAATTAAIVAGTFFAGPRTMEWYEHLMRKMSGSYTVERRLEQFGGSARARLLPDFARVAEPYPPEEVALVAFKDTKQLALYVRSKGRSWRVIRTYPILGSSGALGPKLREGDRQVPEGVYRVVALNPNSRFHVSLRLDYPNAFDRAMAARDGRTDLGGDIMIHGKDRSVGCLALGDEAAEDLFTLAAEAGYERFRVVIVPTDLRKAQPVVHQHTPVWAALLYGVLRAELDQYPVSATPSAKQRGVGT